MCSLEKPPFNSGGFLHLRTMSLPSQALKMALAEYLSDVATLITGWRLSPGLLTDKRNCRLVDHLEL